MNFVALTIFPELFTPFFSCGMIRRGIAQGVITASCINIRDYAEGTHKAVDDRPYGGGPGMVMKPEPLACAIREAKAKYPEAKVVCMTPQGEPFNQSMAKTLFKCGQGSVNESGLILVCGRYEGIDERIHTHFVDLEVSIGDFILTGGELAAMILMDAVSRLVPGVLGDAESARLDSFEDGLLEYAHYTRPAEFEGAYVPDILCSGNHKEIEDWRLKTSLIRTFLKRPDLLSERSFQKREIEMLKKWCREIERIIGAQDLSGADALSGRQ